MTSSGATMLSAQGVRERVAEILEMYTTDPEAAHAAEDALVAAVIRELAERPRLELAKELLVLLDSNRTQWCA